MALADVGSSVHAARLTNVSQPAPSQQLKALEDRLGVTLLERSKGLESAPLDCRGATGNRFRSA